MDIDLNKYKINSSNIAPNPLKNYQTEQKKERAEEQEEREAQDNKQFTSLRGKIDDLEM